VLSARRATANRFAVAAVGVGIGLQVLALEVAPLARLLGLQALSWGDWTIVVTLSVVPAAMGQLIRLRRAR
jgi:hypothetical protein